MIVPGSPISHNKHNQIALNRKKPNPLEHKWHSRGRGFDPPQLHSSPEGEFAHDVIHFLALARPFSPSLHSSPEGQLAVTASGDQQFLSAGQRGRVRTFSPNSSPSRLPSGRSTSVALDQIFTFDGLIPGRILHCAEFFFLKFSQLKINRFPAQPSDFPVKSIALFVMYEDEHDPLDRRTYSDGFYCLRDIYRF